MRVRRFAYAIVLTVGLLLLAVGGVLASPDGPSGGRVIVNEDFTLSDGESVRGDLIILNGSVTLEKGSRVTGNVLVVNGSVKAGGTLDGNLVIFNGDAQLLSSAVVDGDVTVLSGHIRKMPGAQVRGQEIVRPFTWQWEGWRRGPVSIPFWPTFSAYGIAWRILRLVGSTMVIAILAGLVSVLWPEATSRVGRACLRMPAQTVGMGLLTIVLAFVLVVGLLVTICLSPAGLLAAFAVGVAAAYGWIAVGIVIAKRLIPEITSREVSPFWIGVLGAGLLTLLGNMLSLIPCVGWMGGFAVICWGLGAVALTRFGTADYPTTA